MNRRVALDLFAAAVLGVIALSLVGPRVKAKLDERALCKAAPPPATLTAAVPPWQIEPSMFLWKHTPNDQPYPATDLGYHLKLTNQGTVPARNIHVYLGSELFGWQEMHFSYDDKVPDSLAGKCPELQPGHFNFWNWGYTWKTDYDPAWRQSMERTAELRFVWEDDAGWHQVQGHLPSQYSPAKFTGSDLKPLNQ